MVVLEKCVVWLLNTNHFNCQTTFPIFQRIIRRLPRDHYRGTTIVTTHYYFDSSAPWVAHPGIEGAFFYRNDVELKSQRGLILEKAFGVKGGSLEII